MSARLLMIALLSAPGAAMARDDNARERAIENARAMLARSIAEANAASAPPAPPVLTQPAPLVADDPGADSPSPAQCLSPNDLSRAASLVAEKGASGLYALAVDDPAAAHEDMVARREALAAAYLAIGFVEEAAETGAAAQTARGATIARLAGIVLAPTAVEPPHAPCGPYDALAVRLGAHAAGVAQMDDAGLWALADLPAALRHAIGDSLAGAALARGDVQDAAAIRRAALADAPTGALTPPSARLVDALGHDDEAALASLSEMAAAPGALQPQALEALAARFEKLPDQSKAAFSDDLAEARGRAVSPDKRGALDRAADRAIEQGLGESGLAGRMPALAELSRRPEAIARLSAAQRDLAVRDLAALGASGTLRALDAAPATPSAVASDPAPDAAVDALVEALAAAIAPPSRGGDLAASGRFADAIEEELKLVREGLNP